MPDCPNPVNSRNLCGKHYTRWKRHGNPEVTLIQPEDATDEERLSFYGWTVTDTGCWEWAGPRTTLEYGRVGRSGGRTLAHRVAHEAWVGPIPEGHVVRHRCDNPPCINPEHLETGTQADNVQDMHVRRRRGATKIFEDRYPELHELYCVQGLRQTDIAALWGISQAAVSKHLIKMRAVQTAP